jgi:protein-arginine kinase
MVIILVIGIVSAVFGALLIFAPEAILQAERQANRLFMTDTAFLKNRIPIGIGLLAASAFLGYTYAADPLNELVFLVTAVLAGVFGLLLLVSPNTILQAERTANKLYMTDAFFLKHRVVIGVGLLAASAFMVRTYLTFA